MTRACYRVVHLRREVQTMELGVTMEAPVTELVEEYDEKDAWIARLKELEALGFEIRVKDCEAYAVKPGVRRKI